MEELLMCSVCIERYHERKRHPVLLPRCGHSFCRPCVAMLVSGGCVVCPTCRTDQRVDQADRLPTEYTLLAIIHAQENSKKERCERHCVKLSFWCRTCETSTCGECLFEDHPTHSHDVIRASKYITDMKQNAQDVAIKFMEVLDEREQIYYKTIFNCTKRISNAFRNIGVLRKDMEEARELMKGIKEDDSITAATALSEAAKFLGLKWNIQDANLHRKESEEMVKDQVQMEKEKAQQADAKEQAEKKEAKEKEKLCKDARRILRKSKTLSSVEMLKEDEKMADKEKDKSKPVAEKSAEKIEAAKTVDKVKETAIKTEDQKPEEKKAKENVLKVDIKSKENLKPEETKPIKEPVKQEEITIQDIIKMKDLLKKTEDTHNNEEVKDPNNKVEKLPELTKPRPRFPKIKPVFPKKISSPQSIESKSPVEPLPVILEKEPEIASEASSVVNQEPEIKENGFDSKEMSETEEEESEVPPQKPEENGAAAAAAIPVDTENTDSTPSEPPKEKSAKDPLEEMCEPEGKLVDFIQVPGFMVCVEASDGKLASMEWGPQGLHVHCLQFTHVIYDIVIRDSILNIMIPSKAPTVFLELSADETILGRVYITLWGHLRRAHNFLSLCLGDHGHSFLNTKFLQVYNVGSPGERILGGDYETNNGRGGRGVIDDLEWNGDYAMPMKAGMITAAGSGQPATNSLFLICTHSDYERNFSCPFGLVSEGLNVVKEAVQQTATNQVWITDCGVLVEPPRFEYPSSKGD